MIIKNFLKIKKEITKICQKICRNPDEILILAATKGRTPEQIKTIYEAGISVIGENRVQELKQKLPFLPKELRIDFIGHLQRNKVKEVIKICELIHSVDSLKLAEKINQEAEKINKIQKILLEVNLSGEKSKFGFKEGELTKIIPGILKLKNVSLKGLMTMVPEFEDKEKTRPVFKKLRELKEKIEKKFQIPLPILSMGMSNDYEVAIEEGSTIIRLGRAIFGENYYI